MRSTQLFCIALIVCCPLLLAAGDQPAGPKSPAARSAIAKRDRAVAEAERVYRAAVAKANQEMIAELKKAQADVMKSGNQAALAEAQAIQTAIDEVGKRDTATADGAFPVGTWEVRFSDGQLREYIVERDGTVRLRTGSKVVPAGQLARADGRLSFVDQAWKKLRVVYVIDDKMFFENFAGPHPEAVPESLAVGKRMK